ncbi:uncharacterized protein C5orf34 homolog [Sardina pilchardus]|uniref:uncharacterized protein C5orf34 homolog n=1 Tax=Sardina pilchardus TaxID=27697 RepID=UPI002E12F258
MKMANIKGHSHTSLLAHRSCECSLRLMVMYESESVDLHYTNGSRLCVSPCGSEFLFEKALPPSAHPLQVSEKVRQRTRFAISEYKALLVDALTFRNKYATHPFLPEELIPSYNRKWLVSNVSDVDWPAEGSPETTCPGGETILSSVDGNGRLILTSSGEEFFVEFCCRVSQKESPKHLTHQIEESSMTPSRPVSSGEKSVSKSTSEAIKRVEDHRSCESSQQKGHIKPITVGESQSARPGNGYLFTTVVQHHSCASYPTNCHHPLSLAINHWKTQNGESSENLSTNTQEASTSKTCQASKADGTLGPIRSILPESLPLRCPSPHMHRWNTGPSPFNEESQEGMATELVKVLWCQGVLYRIIGGTVPVIEISPGDGSVIRSNGVLANYFTHHKGGCNMESTYYLSSLPPDIPGQKYSVSSVVMRANRILECYNQAKDSLKLTYINCCWKKEVSISEPLKLVHEAHRPDWGHFLAFSDGSAEIIFLDGVKVHTMWRINSITQAQKLGQGHQMHSEVQQPCSWCQLTFPNGQQLLVQADTPGPYHKYLSLSVEWCCWVQQTCLSPHQAYAPEPAQVQSSKTTCSRSVVAELEKIKRFNFLLENSHLIRTHKSSSVPSEDSRTSSGTTYSVGKSSISDALQKTSKAIKDIETLLSHKKYASNSPA